MGIFSFRKREEFPKEKPIENNKKLDSNDDMQHEIPDKPDENERYDRNLQEQEAKLIVETWRLRMAIIQESRFIQDAKSINRLRNQMTRFDKHYFPGVLDIGLEVLDFSGKIYDPGLPINPINLADFQDEDDKLMIEFMMEPVIKIKNSPDIIHKGIAVLGRIKK